MSEQSISHWLRETGLAQDVDSQYRKIDEEHGELHEARNEGHETIKIIREATDLAFVALGLVSVYGGDPDAEMQRMVDKNYVKYPPEAVEGMALLGYSLCETMAILKEQWIGDEAYDNGESHAIQYPLPKEGLW